MLFSIYLLYQSDVQKHVYLCHMSNSHECETPPHVGLAPEAHISATAVSSVPINMHFKLGKRRRKCLGAVFTRASVIFWRGRVN